MTHTHPKFTKYIGDCDFCTKNHTNLIRLIHYDSIVFICKDCLKRALKLVNKDYINKTKSRLHKESIRELDLK